MRQTRVLRLKKLARYGSHTDRESECLEYAAELLNLAAILIRFFYRYPWRLDCVWRVWRLQRQAGAVLETVPVRTGSVVYTLTLSFSIYRLPDWALADRDSRWRELLDSVDWQRIVLNRAEDRQIRFYLLFYAMEAGLAFDNRWYNQLKFFMAELIENGRSPAETLLPLRMYRWRYGPNGIRHLNGLVRSREIERAGRRHRRLTLV